MLQREIEKVKKRREERAAEKALQEEELSVVQRERAILEGLELEAKEEEVVCKLCSPPQPSLILHVVYSQQQTKGHDRLRFPSITARSLLWFSCIATPKVLRSYVEGAFRLSVFKVLAVDP
jgi:hypothetical protein